MTTVIAAVDVGATAKLSFQVILDAGLHAGTIDDTAVFSYDDGTGAIITGATNTVTFTVPPLYGVELIGDVVDSVPQSAMVVFTNVVTNTGNTEDHFNIQLQNVSFPTGTTFTLYSANSVTPLATHAGLPCAGVMPSGRLSADSSQGSAPGRCLRRRALCGNKEGHLAYRSERERGRG